jgi:CBS-domain-containing membrane protein
MMSPELSIEEQAQRLCIYIGESDRWRGKPLYAAILETLKSNGIAGATVVRGVAGFGAHSRIHTAAILRLSEDLPLRIEVIDSQGKIALAKELVSPMVREGLITIEELQVVRYTHRYLNPLPADKPIADVMTREVKVLRPDMSIAQAWESMLKHLIKAMPVVDETGQVVGMLTDEDLLNRAGLGQRLAVAERLEAGRLQAELKDLRSSPLRVADVMSRPAILAHEKESLGTAAARLSKHGIKRLPVVDENGKLVGVVSRVDILQQVTSGEVRKHMLAAPQGAGRQVQEVMYPAVPMVSQDADLKTIIDTLLETGLRRVIVVDEARRPVGLISDADVVSRISPKQRGSMLNALIHSGPTPASDVTAGDIMSPGVLTGKLGMPVVEAASLMLTKQRKWLVVVDSAGSVIGLVDRQVLLKSVSAD